MARPKKAISIMQLRRQQKFIKNRLKKIDSELKKLSRKKKKSKKKGVK